MNLRETAENLVEFARHSKQEELVNVVDAVVNFAREQRIEILNETLQRRTIKCQKKRHPKRK